MKNSLFDLILLCLIILACPVSALAQQSGATLQAAAEAAYDRGYTAEKPADQARAFDEAAALFEQSAEAYHNEGQGEKARSAEHMAGLARQNAEHRRQLLSAYFFSPVGPLAGPGYKLYGPKPTRFYLLPQAGFSLLGQQGLEAFDGGGIDQVKLSIYSRPELLEQLFEKLGGEFFLGSFSAPAELEGFQREIGLYKGLVAGIQVSGHWQVEGSIGVHHSRATANFPVSAFQAETYEPYTHNGQISTEVQNTAASIGVNYTLRAGAFRPYAGLGLRYSGSRPEATEACIADVSFALRQLEAYSTLSPYLSGGIAWQPAGPLLLRISGTGFADRAPKGGQHRLSGLLTLGVGLMF